MIARITSLLLLIAFAGQSFMVFVLQADYLIRYDAYLERCINREKPSLKCNGHCQLVLKMKQAEQSQQDEQAPVSVKQPEPLTKWALAPILHPSFILISPVNNHFLESQILMRSTNDVFHPPCIG